MEFSHFGGTDMIFTILPIIIGIGFILVLGIIIVIVIKSSKQWKRNNESPILTVSAIVVSKRADVNHYHNNSGINNMNQIMPSTTYFATFQVESGDRMEFIMHGTEYGMLIEGDAGKLTFQGTRYRGFERYNKVTF